MSMRFTLQAHASRRVAHLVFGAHACAAAGLLLAAAQLAFADAPTMAMLLLGGLLPTAFAWRRAWQAIQPHASLQVDAAGSVVWQTPGAPAEPAMPVRWLVFGGVVWIELRVGACRVDLLSGRDAHPDQCWRALMCWLRWLDRGTQRPEGLESQPRATI